jgi:acyl-CoA thioester hydrolase
VPAQIFRHQHRVTYAECTLGNHVYYSRPLELLEAARGEFFRHLGCPLLQWQELGSIFPVVECRLRYLVPARYDEVLTVELQLTELQRVRLTFACAVRNQSDRLVLEAETRHVCTGLNEKPKRIPDELAARLKPYVKAAEVGA